MKYRALLELGLSHSYYRDGRCPDFAIEPSVETAQLLRRHRCLCKAAPSALHIAIAEDGSSGQPFVPLAAPTTLRFYLKLQRSDFVLITDLTSLSALSAPTFSSAGLPLGQGGDLLLKGGGEARLPQGVFAAAELTLDRHGTGPAAPQFRIAFQAKRARWAYYCITDLAASEGELTVADANPGGPAEILFGEGSRTALEEAPDPADPIAVQFLGRYPGMRCVRFISDNAVACREEPRRYLELRRGMERICAPLPNPPVRNVARIAAPSPPQDVLYEILKYRTRPFA